MSRRFLALVATAASVLAAGAIGWSAGTANAATTTAIDFVQRSGTNLTLSGKTFKIAGTNNYYLTYKSQAMVDDVLGDAATAQFNVLRSWGWVDIGNADGTNSVAGKADGVYYQYWDGSKPAYNDGADGLAHLDYTIWKAKQLGIRLIIPFTNNWSDFGGMDQYVRWAGGQYHDQFYTDSTIKGWYQAWITHLLTHVNPLTGLAYRDDPTIMMWELANEPRCGGSGGYPKSGTCTTTTVTSWADEMTRYVKRVDRKHLVGVGDEGFFCDDSTSGDWTVNCGDGVDSVALTKLPAVDVMSFHLYPVPWGKGDNADQWGVSWITRHFAEAQKLGKAAMLGEFGLPDKATRNVVYRHWTDAVISARGNGFLYWILSGITDSGTPYGDYDGLTVYCPSPVCTTLTNAGLMLAGKRANFPPVADVDGVATAFGTPVTVSPLANDIAYRGSLKAETLDLDPATAGIQTTAVVTGGTFAVNADATVTFTPATDFFGKATTSYTVRDCAGQLSNPAEITVTVKPNPAAAVRLFSFETGTQGWGSASWQTDAGSVAQTSEWATEGTSSLKITATGGGWFGLVLDQPLDFSTHSTLSFDINVGAAGTNRAVAIQTGSSWDWNQSSFVWLSGDQVVHVELDILSELGGAADGLKDIKALYFYINPGTVMIDNVMLV